LQSIIFLRYYDKYKVNKIADLLNISERMVFKRIKQAKRLMKLKLEKLFKNDIGDILRDI